jgi:hypothetical protein
MAELKDGELILHGRERDDCKYLQIPVLECSFEKLNHFFLSCRHCFWQLSYLGPQGGTLLDGSALHC